MKLSTLSRARATRRAAFTLLEVLVVVAILVILAGVASISVFRYMEDAKVGRAKADMQAIQKAYTTYYSQKGTWPSSPAEVTVYLEQGQNAMTDPWGNQYQANVVQTQAADGTEMDRVVVTCNPPGGKPAIQYPER